MSNIEITFENPWLLLLVIPSLAVILIPFLLLPKKRRKTFKKIAPVILHSVIAVFLVLILSEFSIVKNSDEQAVMLLVDLSDSMGTVQEAIAERTEEILNLIDENTPTGVMVFGGNHVYSLKLGEERLLELSAVSSDATDIESALEYAADQLPSDRAGRIIILSDGKETDGDAAGTAHYLATRGIRMDAVYFDTTELLSDEIQIGSFTSPEGVYVGDEVVFTAEIKSNVNTYATLILYDGENEVKSESITVTEGSTVIEITDTPTDGGIHSYHLQINPESDTILENNECYAYLNVAGESTVLIIADTIRSGNIISDILSESSAVTVVTAGNAPDNIAALCNYDEVILSNVDYEKLPSGYDELLRDYVSVYGRSLLAVGGEDTFMYGNMEETLIEELLPVTFSVSESAEGNSVALMLVLDTSSSMSRQSTYLSVAKQGAIKCVEAMSDNDYVGVISFNRSAYLKSSLIEANEENKDTLTRIISGLNTSQGTYYTEALEMAHEELNKSSASVKHIIFLSDGNPSDRGYTEAVEDASEDGITVTTIGLGYSSSTLESLAEKGGGRYYYVKSATDLPDIMLSETEQVTVSSLITGEFYPVTTDESPLTESSSPSLPVLYGYLGTTIKENATAYLSTEEGHPIYAVWSYGNGTVACFTSDLSGVWSAEWLDDSVGRAITLNMVETTVSDSHHDSSLTMDTSIRGKTADITVYTTSSDIANAVSITVYKDGKDKTYVLTQTDPGVYEKTIPLETPGSYELMVVESDTNDSIVDYLEAGVALSYSSEYDAYAKSGESFLESLCSYSGGEIFTDMAALSDVELTKISIIYNPMVLLAVLSLILFLADIAIRKLRLKDIKNYLLRAMRKGL